MADPDEIVRRELEKLGEDAVRLKQAQCQWGMPGTRGHAVVSEWLRKLEEEQASHDPSTQVEWPTGNTLAIIAIITAISSVNNFHCPTPASGLPLEIGLTETKKP